MNNLISVRRIHRWVAPTLRVLKHKKDRLPPRPQDPRKSFVEWNYNAELYSFSRRLGEDFNDKLLRQALTDRRYLEMEEKRQKDVGIEPEIQLQSNDELVDEGHRFIQDYVKKYLKQSLPKLPKYYLDNIENYLMSEDNLAYVSKHIGIDDILLIDKDFPDAESLTKGLKAVINAVENKTRAERLVRDLIVSQLCGYDLTKLTTPIKPIEELEKTLSQLNYPVPEYRLIAQSAVNTLLPLYHAGIYCDKKYIGRGFGESVTVAKEMAACDVLWKLWGISRRKPFNMDVEPPKPVAPIRIDVTN